MSEQDKQLAKKIPSLDELYAHPQQIAKANALNVLLNNPPKAEWQKEHPMAKGVKYIPIEIIEYLLTSIFIKWRVEVKEIQLVANSVVVTARLWYMDPVSGDWDYQDGIGANPLQTDKGAAATDFTKVKNDSVMKAAPAAESYAIKDAAEKLGKIFGKDLNRKDEMGYGHLKDKKIDPMQGVDQTDANPQQS